jgi:hypothetical protein
LIPNRHENDEDVYENAMSYIVGATLAVAQPKEGRGKPCPYNLMEICVLVF